MEPTPESIIATRHRHHDLLNRLKELFNRMDQAYGAAAERYGFRCTGCADNCCLTRFYHHTLLEVLYLMEGMATLAPPLRRALVQQARRVEARAADADRHGNGRGVRRMCPLNQDGRCLLYAYRPMICRLHGIPHELRRPGREAIRNPGCAAFFDQCRKGGINAYIPFDRTPFYRDMASLEKELRRETGYDHKIKLTIAQMLTTVMEPPLEID